MLEHVELRGDHPQILGVFVGEVPEQRIVEIKLDGVLQHGLDELLARAAGPPVDQMVALREVAIVVRD